MFKAYDLRQKEVININTAERMGFIRDVEIDFESGKIKAVIIPRRKNFFSHIWGKNDYMVLWNNIIKIGRDLVLVDYREDIDQIVIESKTNYDI